MKALPITVIENLLEEILRKVVSEDQIYIRMMVEIKAAVLRSLLMSRGIIECIDKSKLQTLIDNPSVLTDNKVSYASALSEEQAWYHDGYDAGYLAAVEDVINYLSENEHDKTNKT